MHWLFLFGWNWSFLADSEWLFPPGANTCVEARSAQAISNLTQSDRRSAHSLNIICLKRFLLGQEYYRKGTSPAKRCPLKRLTIETVLVQNYTIRTGFGDFSTFNADISDLTVTPDLTCSDMIPYRRILRIICKSGVIST